MLKWVPWGREVLAPKKYYFRAEVRNTPKPALQIITVRRVRQIAHTGQSNEKNPIELRNTKPVKQQSDVALGSIHQELLFAFKEIERKLTLQKESADESTKDLQHLENQCNANIMSTRTQNRQSEHLKKKT